MKVLTTKTGMNHQPPVNSDKLSTSSAGDASKFLDAISLTNSGIKTEDKTTAVENFQTQSQEAELDVSLMPNFNLPPAPVPEVKSETLQNTQSTDSPLNSAPLMKMDLAKISHIGAAPNPDLEAAIPDAAMNAGKNALTALQALQAELQPSIKSEAKINLNPLLKTNAAAPLQVKSPVTAPVETKDKIQKASSHTTNDQKHLANSATPMTDLLPPLPNKIAASLSMLDTHPADLQNNKYAIALTQLGNFINSHTALHAGNDSGAPRLDFNTAQAGYTESIKKTALPEYETRIELSAQTLDAVSKDTYKANIKINPPELGHVVAKLQINKDNAELIILTQSNSVKEIVQANLAQLRENFQNADINLTTIDVQTQAFPDSSPKEQFEKNQADSQAATFAENANPLNPQTISSPEAPRHPDSIIDTYA